MKRKMILTFDASLVEQPIMYRLIKEYDLMVNILKANIDFNKRGIILIEIEGERFEEGIKFLESIGIEIKTLAQEVVRHEEKCIQCSACITLCPSGALHINRDTMEVLFNHDNCIICGECVKSCPQKAMEVRF
ncbi:MAG: 4Fe-4S dicluster domain-containing protein [Ignavibacteriales bacterium]